MSRGTSDRLDLADIQGLVARGYGTLPHAAFLLLHVDDPGAARGQVRRWADDVGSAAAGAPPEYATHLAFTATGLRALRGPGVVPDGFAEPFRTGMVTEYRSRLLGDVEANAPQNWAWGGPSTESVHLLVLQYAVTPDVLTERVDSVQAAAADGGLRVLARLDASELSDRDAFGFRDGISQPTVEGLSSRRSADMVRAGEFVLGYHNEYGQRTERPLLPAAEDPAGLLPHDPDGSGCVDLGRNGSYLVVRQLVQDVEGFWAFADRAGAEHPELGSRERVAAKIVGRWPSGAPLVLAPEQDDERLADANDFDYHASDPRGLACPLGAHVRRTNPRDSLEPAPGTERSRKVNRGHRLLRRGRTYDRDGERGLVFICLNASLTRQYEFVQHSWLNDPAFHGLRDSEDPLVGPRAGGPTTLALPADPVRHRLHGLPQFVRVTGGAYFFLPGLRALHYLGSPVR